MSMGWWVGVWVFECVDVFRTSVLDPWCFHRSHSTTTTNVVRHLFAALNTWWVGRSLRGRYCCTTFCCTAVGG